MKSNKYYTEANRKAWNEATPKHRVAMDEKWDKMFSAPEFIYQKNEELDELNKLEYKGKRIAHLSCNNGIELLSLKKNGAERCMGFDISDEAIKDANQRAKKFHIDCEFVRSDVLEIDPKFNDSFDLVYVTVGALVWIPDLAAYFQKAADLLVVGGKIFIYEHHPIGEMFPYDDEFQGESEELTKLKYPYFTDEIWEDKTGIDYYGGTVYDSSTSYEFSYTISDMINKLISCGFAITRFNEYSRDIALGHQKLNKMGKSVPLSYIMIGEKR